MSSRVPHPAVFRVRVLFFLGACVPHTPGSRPGILTFSQSPLVYDDANIFLTILQTRRSTVITMATTSNPANTSHHFRWANIVM